MRLAEFSADDAVARPGAVVVVARGVAAHDLPRNGGGKAVVARRVQRDALLLVRNVPLGHVRWRGRREALAPRDAVLGIVRDFIRNVQGVVARAAREQRRR